MLMSLNNTKNDCKVLPYRYKHIKKRDKEEAGHCGSCLES